jgi:phosphoglycolate phosphatase-like HAD superfamily hydrolase
VIRLEIKIVDIYLEGEINLKILFWDIDGTLIKTGKAGLFAFEQATAEIWSKTIDFSQITTAGMTDYSIAAEIVEAVAGRPARAAEVIRLAERYEELLDDHLAQREGIVLPSIREILDRVHRTDEYKSLLLTGNSRVGAELKMRKFGLDHYFDFDSSAFCNRHHTRDEVAAIALAYMQAQTVGPAAACVIGDTPNDIRCGKAIGAYTIGVATGGYPLAKLESCSPWWAVERLPSAEEFFEKLKSVE